MLKTDYKKLLDPLYTNSRKEPHLVEVPRMKYLMVDGEGDPNTSHAFAEAVEALFGLSYTLKFTVRKMDGGVDYGVMPLEGLWWTEPAESFSLSRKDDWKWTAMIMQPDFITMELAGAASDELVHKKKSGIYKRARLEEYNEGASAQILHIGPYAEEEPTVDRLHRFIHESGYGRSGRHHEIYLNDARRTAPGNLKTVIRQPVVPQL